MKSLEELRALREKMKSQTDNRSVAGSDETVIKVGMATCGIAAGARPVLDALLDEADKRHLHNVSISQTGCIGMCRMEPIVEVFRDGQKYTYVLMTPDKARKVMNDHVVNGNVVKERSLKLHVQIAHTCLRRYRLYFRQFDENL